MQIAFHIGAHCTDEDRLLKSVLKNADVLWQQGIAVPGPGKYRSLIREAIQGLAGNDLHPDTRDILLDAITDTDDLRRLVLSNENFLCVPNRIYEHGVFYPQAETKTRGLHRLFPDDDISLFLAIRNPAGFLQDTLRRVQQASIGAALGVLAPEEIRWSDVVRRIKLGAPDTPLTVWCNEDSPLIWDQLIRRLSGASAHSTLAGGTDLLATVLDAQGLTLLSDSLAKASYDTDADRHDMIAAIWADHALPDAIEEEITLPEMDAATVAHLTALYEQDLDVIDAMPGVELLLPFR
ncbi:MULTISPECIES: hypothetical protein [unclassified Yoonia]|uniref:hypothetical protein n=1 Tax=unclassified Yoonia TaxID=2629118 RepID=UPI002AFFA840|nr:MULTISPECIES: hypothetical protein [unclassified Yoonia]